MKTLYENLLRPNQSSHDPNDPLPEISFSSGYSPTLISEWNFTSEISTDEETNLFSAFTKKPETIFTATKTKSRKSFKITQDHSSSKLFPEPEPELEPAGIPRSTSQAKTKNISRRKVPKSASKKKQKEPQTLSLGVGGKLPPSFPSNPKSSLGIPHGTMPSTNAGKPPRNPGRPTKSPVPRQPAKSGKPAGNTVKEDKKPPAPAGRSSTSSVSQSRKPDNPSTQNLQITPTTAQSQVQAQVQTKAWSQSNSVTSHVISSGHKAPIPITQASARGTGPGTRSSANKRNKIFQQKNKTNSKLQNKKLSSQLRSPFGFYMPKSSNRVKDTALSYVLKGPLNKLRGGNCWLDSILALGLTLVDWEKYLPGKKKLRKIPIYYDASWALQESIEDSLCR
eukprot:CAMPEP_0116997198 /NCGR_PEP_ID=MMETSP0472-20121206/723_1 /TAXON_ID=693140 ORGANISM="Tiarina fusus, Strain LIS" /NCGR_SAMPLE_ID=MMETSP0472 /ASSEMBLY_ACC=CAM_ASM_000603 /LENGTH=393 /DNA_ID=CAMNT_0004696017 /DNA_START=404 /DNA_END=1581 /DNA_ORIENTATION=-